MTDTQVDALVSEFIGIVLMTILTLWVIVLAGALTRMRRYGILSTALFILAFLAAGVSAIGLGLELFLDVILTRGYQDLTTLLISLLMISLVIPSAYVMKYYGEDRLKEEEIARHFDRSANDAFTIGITLQVIILTLLTSGALFTDNMVDLFYLFSLVVMSQLIVYDLSFFYHIRKQKAQFFRDTQVDNQDHSDTGLES